MARGLFMVGNILMPVFFFVLLLPSLSDFTQNQHKLFFMLLLNIVGVVIKAVLLENRYLNLLPAAMSLVFYFISRFYTHTRSPFPYFHINHKICIFSSLYFISHGMATGGKQENKCFVTFTDGALEQTHR